MIDHTKISKAEWLSLARSYYTHLLEELDSMSEAEWKTRTRYLGWSCKDLVNHMTSAITVNFNLLLQMALDGNPVPEPGFNLFLRNANEVFRRRKNTIRETIDEFKREITKLLDRFDTLSEEQWRAPAFFFIGDIDVCNLFLVQYADNVVHEHDLLIANHRWNSFDPKYAEPLIDWFMCAFRPGSFRPENANNTSATIQYHITGNINGHWWMRIENSSCIVSQGKIENAETTITVNVEDLIGAALARSSPLTGRFARSLEWMVAKNKHEE